MFIASLYKTCRTDTGHDFSLYFAYELLMNFRNIYMKVVTLMIYSYRTLIIYY